MSSSTSRKIGRLDAFQQQKCLEIVEKLRLRQLPWSFGGVCGDGGDNGEGRTLCAAVLSLYRGRFEALRYDRSITWVKHMRFP